MALTAPTLCASQSVRGTVTDHGSAPIAGVVIQLLDASGTSVARAVSDEIGAYRIVAPGAGVYRIRTQRIGYRPTVTATIELRILEEISRAIVVAGVPFSLDTFRVTDRRACRIPSDTAAATFALWEQVRTAITAASVTVSDKEIGATVLTYERTLDPSFRRVNSQVMQVKSGFTTRAWRSLPPDSLHRAGYVFVSLDGWTTYFAPDLEVLLSNTFVEDHCFRLADDPAKNRVGLEFQPTRERRAPDIRGWMWLDRKTAELQTLEYRYTNIRSEQENANAGGTVNFKRLRNGLWVITRWDIRLPMLAETMDNLNAGIPGAQVVHRVRVNGMKVSGGELALVTRRGDTLWSHPPLTISGVVMDTTAKRASADAILVLKGTNIRATSTANGAYTLTGVIPGEYTLEVTTPSLDSIGIAKQMIVEVLDSSVVQPINLESLAKWIDRFCGGKLRGPGMQRGVIVGTVLRADSLAATGLQVAVEWSQPILDLTSVGTATRRVEAATDSRGVFRACGVPIDRPAIVRTAWDTDGTPPRDVRIPADAEIALIRFVVSRPVAAAASLSGRVIADSTHSPVQGAEVVLAEANIVARSAPNGEYRIGSIPPGAHTVIVRRLGYRPATEQIVFGRNELVVRDFTIKAAAVTLDTLVVKSARPKTEFEDRRATGLGHFIGRAELAKVPNKRMSEVLSTVPGLRVLRAKTSAAWITQGRNLSSDGVPVDAADMAKGARPDCYADVWLDGVRVYSGRPYEPLFDVNSLQPDDIETFEFFSGEAQIPAKYTRMGRVCGVAVIHTRISK